MSRTKTIVQDRLPSPELTNLQDIRSEINRLYVANLMTEDAHNRLIKLTNDSINEVVGYIDIF